MKLAVTGLAVAFQLGGLYWTAVELMKLEGALGPDNLTTAQRARRVFRRVVGRPVPRSFVRDIHDPIALDDSATTNVTLATPGGEASVEQVVGWVSQRLEMVERTNADAVARLDLRIQTLREAHEARLNQLHGATERGRDEERSRQAASIGFQARGLCLIAVGVLLSGVANLL